MRVRRIVFILLIPFLVTSCANYKDVPYFQNSQEFQSDASAVLYDMTIKPKDQLSIFVFSGTDKEAVRKFTVRDPVPLDITQKQIRSYGSGRYHHYLVDNEGNIDFPVLGQVHVAGYTLTEAQDYIKKLVAPYLKEGTDYTVNVMIDNFEVTVMGEVKTPNTFTISRPKVSILEALAMAGDMTIYGNRDNVKVLRELPNGEYEIHQLDLRDANILNSPYFYLHQRDIVYVEPNEAMAQNSKLGRTRQLWIRGASITVSLGSLLYRVLQ